MIKCHLCNLLSFFKNNNHFLLVYSHRGEEPTWWQCPQCVQWKSGSFLEGLVAASCAWSVHSAIATRCSFSALLPNVDISILFPAHLPFISGNFWTSTDVILRALSAALRSWVCVKLSTEVRATQVLVGRTFESNCSNTTTTNNQTLNFLPPVCPPLLSLVNKQFVVVVLVACTSSTPPLAS